MSSTTTTSPQIRLLDSHIHLWPATSTTPLHHGWMTPGHFLSKQHGIQDYDAVTKSYSSPQEIGFVYVETDRYLPSSAPGISLENGSEKEKVRKLKEWASEKLEELKFLRRMVEDVPVEGDGFSASSSSSSGDATRLKGTVIWAPFHLSPQLFDLYLKIAEEVSGPKAWERVVGFRFLLQGKREGEVKVLAGSPEWVQNVARLGEKWSFDIGVDIHRDGVEQLEYMVQMVQRVREIEKEGRVKFVLNHLCKPDLSTPHSESPSFARWSQALRQLGADQHVYMKLSGGFNEFDPVKTPSSTTELLDALRPYLAHIFKSFPNRVMFGSDWPVCNVGGPKGEVGSWQLWYEFVQSWCEEAKLTEEERDFVWWKAGAAAYGITL